MKNKVKKILTSLFFALLICANIFAAPINIEKGYKDLNWGITVKQAQCKGYKLSIISEMQGESIQKNFKEKVDIYFVKPTEKNITGIYFVYYKDKFVYVREVISNISVKNIKSRYGDKLFATGLAEGEYASKDSNGNINGRFIIDNHNIVIADFYDFNAFSKISVARSNSSNSGSSSDFVRQFDGLAQKLLQDPKKSSKATYAFLDFSTDNKNSSVEKYITDALTEAVFNTGKVKIIERANLEKILNEQKFQASGLVDESQAANIGNIAGVEYVCYGTIKEIENGYTVSARVVDVESGEICAMSRTNITKDSYLENAGTGSSVTAKKTTGTSAKNPVNSLWTCETNRNEFDEYTTYTFILKGPQNEFLFFGYDKYDAPSMSKVRAGYSRDYWTVNNNGTYDFKTESKGTITKDFYNNASWSKKTGWQGKGDSFGFTYDKNSGARFFIKLFEENNYLTIRRNQTDVRRFQTQGFWEIVESYGITKEEIDDAIANEEF